MPTDTAPTDPAVVDDALPGPYALADAHVESYRRDGFVQVDDVVTGDALAAMRDAVAAAVEREDAEKTDEGRKGIYAGIFNQKVNLWERHPAVARFALSRRLGDIAARLEGRDMRVWHDQALFKGPNQDPGNPTPWHQDAPYWPQAERAHSVSIWLALKDATVENGCMAFVPGSQAAGPLRPIDLDKGHKYRPNLLDAAPQFKGVKADVRPLRAGSATFHNGLTFHYAGANRSDAVREAFVVIYMPADVAYTGEPHVVTDPIVAAGRLPLAAGGPFPDAMFPLVGRVG